MRGLLSLPTKCKLNVFINDEPWFVGKEAATMLGYKDTSDTSKKHVDDEDKRFFKIGEMPTLKTSNCSAYLINESGLYSLIPAMHVDEDEAVKRSC